MTISYLTLWNSSTSSLIFLSLTVLLGCKLSWAHLKDSDDIDGIVCVDLRFQLKVYTQDTVGEKYWPFVISPLDDSLQEIVFAVGVEDIQESWVTNLESSLQYVSTCLRSQFFLYLVLILLLVFIGTFDYFEATRGIVSNSSSSRGRGQNSK